MVAKLRAGGAFVPLDPSHPTDRLKAIIEKAGAKVVVTFPTTAQLFRNISVSLVEVSPSVLESCDASVNASLSAVGPDHAAFVLFTSGRTGKPKGIIQEHASVCTSAIAHGNALHVTSESRVFQYAAFTFDVSMMDIFTTLIHGGCVCIPSEEDHRGLFTTVMNRMRVNWVLFTPSVASLIKPEDVPSLQTLVYSGEVVKQENVSRWVDKVRLFNCYGPAGCGACAIGEFIHRDARPANIGRQFGGELCWVVDPENHNQLLPIGAVGELVVEGPTLARVILMTSPRPKLHSSKAQASMNIFLTGSTGYLGCRILGRLCRNLNVRRVLVHVRSQKTRQALERITKSARLAGWWNDDYSTKLVVWTGDLAKPKLGLCSEQWKRMCGHGPPQERVTAIIHNGATVNWNASFPVLKATNVDSVVDLLTAASDSASLTDFVYVSGGRTPQVEDDDDAQIAEEIGR
ncbi:MAG: hypothetical protein L6R42_003561 [Xanthoria sp. 1 TBL-2021]|nr:MAG: hypothetical protein L6R42_003561 [Xanthoria sp. 1 TBL-2021]